MINFNGTTRKRNVNLSGNRKPLKGSGKSYLEQLSQERSNRAKAKHELNSAIKIQSAIRRHNVLRAAAEEFVKEWDPNSVDLTRSIDQFVFISLHYSGDIEPIMNQLFTNYKNADLSGIPDATLENFLKALGLLYSKLLCRPNHSSIVGEIVDILLFSSARIQKLATLDDKVMAALLRSLNETASRSENKNSDRLLELIFTYGHFDWNSVIRLLSSNDSMELIAPIDQTKLNSISELLGWISKNSLENTELSDQEIFTFLGNFVEILSSHGMLKSAGITMSALGNILSLISSEVVFEQDLDGDSIMYGSGIIVADSHLTQSMETIFSRDLMFSFFKTLELGKLYESFSRFLYSSLRLLNTSALRPTNQKFKGKIVMSMIASDACALIIDYWFTDILMNDEFILDLLEAASPSRQLELPTQKLWWRTLYLLEEVISYMLIVQNDVSLSRLIKSDMFPTFVTFLKRFSLHIAVNGRGVRSTWIENELGQANFDFLCHSSFRLFGQLYLKNTRIHFLDDDFWTMNKSVALSFRFNTENVIQLLNAKTEADENSESSVFGSNFSRARPVRDESKAALTILTYMPFLIPFETRAQIFEALIEAEKMSKLNNYRSFFLETNTKLRATISRENLLFDAFEAFGETSGTEFKRKLDVTFVNEFGPESGIDGGGLTKEFLTSVCKDGFQYVNFDDDTLNTDRNGSDYNFFKQTPKTYQVYPSTDYFWRQKYQQQQVKLHNGRLESSYDFTEENQFFAKMMRFLGMVIGKCLYENVLIDISFAPFFLSKWCSVENVDKSSPQYRNSFDDLKYLDESLYENLIKLLDMSNDELLSLELYFNISEKLPHQSEVVTVDLVPNGSKIQVDQSNKLQYVYAVANFKLNTLINSQSKFFLDGLFQIIQPSWLNLFSHTELLMLVSGGDKEVDIDDLRANTEYGGYLENDLTVKLFWEVVSEFTLEEKSKLIKFVTSSSKAPLLGFKELTPKFGIRDSLDPNRLPTLSTCVNLLKLPNYRNKKVLREKLLYAINAGSGFDLS